VGKITHARALKTQNKSLGRGTTLSTKILTPGHRKNLQGPVIGKTTGLSRVLKRKST